MGNNEHDEKCPKCGGTNTRQILDIKLDQYTDKYNCRSCGVNFKPKKLIEKLNFKEKTNND